MPVIKRYTNRKFYNGDRRCYVTLDDIAEMVQRDEDVQVIDYASGENLTTIVLAQILFEQQKKLGGMLPQVILTRLVRSGGNRFKNFQDSLRAFLDPVQHADEEILFRLRILVGEGKISENESERIEELLLAPYFRQISRAAFEDDADSESLQPASLEEMEVLLHQLEQLEQELDALKLSR